MRTIFRLICVSLARLITSCGGGLDARQADVPAAVRASAVPQAACGFERIYVTVERVDIYKAGADGPREVVLASPRRIDLVSLPPR